MRAAAGAPGGSERRRLTVIALLLGASASIGGLVLRIERDRSARPPAACAAIDVVAPSAAPRLRGIVAVLAARSASTAAGSAAPRAVLPAAADSGAPPLPARVRPDSERGYQRAWAARAASEPDTFAAEADETLRGAGPLAEKVGVLRAWLAAGIEPRYGGFRVVLADATEPEALRDFAFRSLQEAAADDPRARRTLLEHWSAGRADGRDRARASRILAATANAGEIAELAALLRTETDVGVLRPAIAELQQRNVLAAGALVVELQQREAALAR